MARVARRTGRVKERREARPGERVGGKEATSARRNDKAESPTHKAESPTRRAVVSSCRHAGRDEEPARSTEKVSGPTGSDEGRPELSARRDESVALSVRPAPIRDESSALSTEIAARRVVPAAGRDDDAEVRGQSAEVRDENDEVRGQPAEEGSCRAKRTATTTASRQTQTPRRERGTPVESVSFVPPSRRAPGAPWRPGVSPLPRPREPAHRRLPLQREPARGDERTRQLPRLPADDHDS
jgi:hypothetical protein